MKEEVYKMLKSKHCFNLKEFKEEEIRMTFFWLIIHDMTIRTQYYKEFIAIYVDKRKYTFKEISQKLSLSISVVHRRIRLFNCLIYMICCYYRFVLTFYYNWIPLLNYH